MVLNSLDEREIQLLLVALRYWRTHRSDGATRRTDPQFTADLVDLLLSKLGNTLPLSDDVGQASVSFSGEPLSAADDGPSGSDSRPKRR